MQYSRIWLRINTDAENGGEDIVAEYRGDTREFLENCLVRPATEPEQD